MNVINFGERACAKVQGYFDSYLDNELLIETNHEVLKHLSQCATCRTVLDQRQYIKKALKRGVEAEPIPAELLNSIQQSIRSQPQRRWGFDLDWRHQALAAAAVIILAVGTFVVVRQQGALSPQSSSDHGIVQKIRASAHELFETGFLNHIHCTLDLGRWKTFLSLDEMKQATGRRALGTEFIGLVPVVQEKLGENFKLVQGHRCRVLGRDYVHLILTGESGEIVSLVITEKSDAESFSSADAVAVANASGAPVYGSTKDGLEVAAFETRRFLGYVVSNMAANNNLKLAGNLIPSVREFLLGLEA